MNVLYQLDHMIMLGQSRLSIQLALEIVAAISVTFEVK